MVPSADCRNKHKAELQFPAESVRFEYKPYFEAGVGVENILKIFRVDALSGDCHI